MLVVLQATFFYWLRIRKKGNQASLFRESSVRLAAGVFFNTVINSDDFRRALLNFHEGKSTKVFVANIQEIIKGEEQSFDKDRSRSN